MFARMCPVVGYSVNDKSPLADLDTLLSTPTGPGLSHVRMALARYVQSYGSPLSELGWVFVRPGLKPRGERGGRRGGEGRTKVRPFDRYARGVIASIATVPVARRRRARDADEDAPRISLPLRRHGIARDRVPRISGILAAYKSVSRRAGKHVTGRRVERRERRRHDRDLVPRENVDRSVLQLRRVREGEGRSGFRKVGARIESLARERVVWDLPATRP